jgi:hypothetical protein
MDLSNIEIFIKLIFFMLKYLRILKLTMNTSQFYSPLFYPGMTNISIDMLNMDPNAYIVLLSHPELINWNIIQYNRNNAPIYQKYPEQITWTALNRNQNLYSLIQTDISKVQW